MFKKKDKEDNLVITIVTIDFKQKKFNTQAVTSLEEYLEIIEMLPRREIEMFDREPQIVVIFHNG